MPQRDISNRAVERAANVAQRAIKKLRGRIPLGPDTIQFNQQEFDNQLRKANGQKILAFMEALGDDTTRENLRRD